MNRLAVQFEVAVAGVRGSQKKRLTMFSQGPKVEVKRMWMRGCSPVSLVLAAISLPKT